MAAQLIHYTATIPAGTAIAAPVTVAIPFSPRQVRLIDWRVPNGPMGTFGWHLAMGGVQVLPNSGDTWVVANDEHGTWQTDDYPDSGAWQVAGYNTGVNPHSVYLAFHCDLPVRTAAIRVLRPAMNLMVPGLVVR